MPRRSTRDIFPALVDVQVDVTGKGATVSDEIQLIYLLDDLRSSFWVTGGAGLFLAAGGGTTHGAIQITCQNRRGLVIDELLLVLAAGGANTIFAVRVTDTPTVMTSETILTSALGTPLPHAVVRRGHITQALFTGDRVTMGSNDVESDPGYGRGIQVSVGQTLIMMQDQTNANSLMSIVWHELDRELVT